MSYIDGFVAAVPSENKQKYIEHAKLSGVVFRMHPEDNPMPFDGKRLIYGGFEVLSLDE